MQVLYAVFIDELRAASAHTYRQDTLITQQSRNPGLIRATFISGATHLDLWITPQDLYVRGFTNQYGRTFQFNDADFNLQSALGILRYNPGGGFQTLTFGSNYNALEGRNGAERGRQSTPFNYTAFWNTFFNLAFMTSPTGADRVNCARSLLTMIQLTSEAARFNDVYGVMHDAMGSGTYTGLPMFQQNLENGWSAISNFALVLNQQGFADPLTLTGANANNGNSATSAPNSLTLFTWSDIQRYLRIMLGTPLAKQYGGLNGNWDYSQL